MEYLIFILGCLIACAIAFAVNKAKVFNFMNRIKKDFFAYIIEFVMSIISLVLLFQCFIFYHYWHNFNVILYVLSIVSLSILIIVICKMINNSKSDLSKLFIIIMIPIGLTFLMCMLPDYVPDEQAHFQRAYQVSWLHLNTGINGMIDSDYAIMKFSDYKNIFSYININPNPTYKMYHEACAYNFTCYIIPAMVLAVCRILHFSLYLSYYLGRMANLILYIVLISYAIKITPKCKKIFFVLGFNPMFIHLAASYSADVLVTSISVLSIAYFLYLFEKAEISKKDVIIVLTMIFIIAMTKYVYLPVFGIYFAIIPKLLKMPKINWMVLVICAIVGCAYIYVSLKLNTNTEVIASQKEYYEAANVDGARQLEFLLSDKLNILRVLKTTFVTKIFYYFDNFINRLGWLTIFINKFSFVFYYVILVLAPFVESAKLNIKNRIWFVVIGGIISILVVMGLYLYFTPVGWLTSEGVQGRYFIPCAALFLVALSNGLLKKFDNNLLFAVSVFVINILVANDILMFFI